MNRWRLSAHCTKCQATIDHARNARDGHAWTDANMLAWTALGTVGMRCPRCGPVDAETRALLLSGVWWPDRLRPMGRGIAINDNNDTEETGT